jgi:hypothetical protein
MVFNVYQQGDQVGYHGAKFKGALGGKEGFIVSKIEGEPNGYVVTFPEMKQGDQDYIMPVNVLGVYRPSKNEPKHDHNKPAIKVEQRRPGGRSKKAAPAPTEED